MELLYRALLLAYPRRYRAEYGAAMLEMVRIQRRRAGRSPQRLSNLRFWAFAFDDLCRSVAAERSSAWRRRRASTLVVSGRDRGFTPNDSLDTMQTLAREIRHAARRLARAPMFTCMAVLITALGIGANTAMFSFVDALLLRPQPYARPAEIVTVYQDSDDGEPSSSSFPAYLDMTAYDNIFSSTTAIMSWSANLLTEDSVQRLAVEYVSASYFGTLGLQPLIGRDLVADDDLVGAEPVAILSHATWQDRFGSDREILGTRLRLDGGTVTIVGIGPEGYGGVLPGFHRDLFLSLSSIGPVVGDWAAATLQRRADHWFLVKARLAPGVTSPQAQAAMDALANRLAAQFPEYNEGRQITVFGAGAVRLHPSSDGQLLPMAAALMAIVGLVLLIACSNLANLLLVRGSARARDVSIRMALGASRGRILWHVLTESVLLSALGGLLGLGLALWATRVFTAANIPLPFPAPIDLRIDLRVFSFTATLSIATGMLFGLLPGLRIARSDVISTLRDDVAAMSLGPGKLPLRNILVVAQVAVSFLILVIAGLFVRSLGNAQRVDLGYDGTHLAAIATDAAHSGYDSAAAWPLLEDLRERIEALPGVEAAALTGQLPVRGTGGSSTLVIDGYMPPDGTSSVEVLRSVVGARYFDTIGIPILHGRAFDPQDAASGMPVVMVSEAMARAYWGRPDVVGERFRGQGSSGWFEIIGVAADVKVRDITEAPTPLFYRPLGDTTFAYVVARAAADPANLLTAMRAQLRQVDATLRVLQLKTFDQHLSEALAMPRLGVRLLGGFGLLGLSLASLGLYAVVAFTVERRTMELGIRMALGASGNDVVAMVVREVMVIVIIGMAIGLGLAWLALPSVATALYGVSPADPLALLGTAALLAVTAIIAGWLPARRAAGVDPVKALRHE